MPILFRWIFRGCFNKTLLTTFALLSIFVIAEVFDKTRFLGDGMSGWLLFEYLLMKLPMALADFMPVIMLFSAAMFLTGLSRHQEIVAMRSAGLGLRKLLAPLLIVAMLAAILVFVIGEWVTPITNQRLDHIERTHIQHKQPQQHGTQWLKDGQRFLRLQPLGDQQFKLMVLETDLQGRWQRRIDAADATYKDGAWQMHDVQLSVPSELEGMKLRHVQHMSLPTQIGSNAVALPNPRHMKFIALNDYATELQSAGLKSAEYRFTLHHKVAAPLACLMMVILAIALSMQLATRTRAISFGLLATIVLGLLFYIFGNTSYLLASGEHLPPVFAAWLPNLIFGGLAGFLLLRREGY
ncbi:MAG: LPS export ABC transporter permease LptG [Mariprofundaceae bacterium]